MSASALRDRILSRPDYREELVHVTEWEVDVLVRGMTGKQRGDMLQHSGFAKTGTLDLNALQPDIVISCVRDPESKELLFSKADREAILEKAGSALDRVMQVAMRLSGMEEGAVGAVKSGDTAEPGV